MGFADYLVLALILAIVGAAALYIYRAKKKGVKCIGCPEGATCGGKCGSNCGGNCGGSCSCGKN